jgi:hypothetical protein
MMKSAARFLSLALLGAGLPGCGGGNSSTAPVPPPTAPPPAVTTLLQEGSFSGLGARILASVPFDTTATGTIEATVDWTFATDNVEAYLVRGTCTVDQFNNLTCPFAAFSESPTAKPERIRATSQAPGSFNLYIGNRGPAEEAVSFQIFLTTGGSGSSAKTTRVVRGVVEEGYLRMLSPR